MGVLTPRTGAPFRPDEGDNYVRSYLVLRLVIGSMGVCLPLLLLIGDWLFGDFEGGPRARGSISAYYHSGVRDLFVATLAVTGFFLLTYKIFQPELENTLSIVAGVTVLGVALLPTGVPDGSSSLPTPLQDRVGEHVISVLHFCCAVTFILCTAVISYYFGVQEGVRDQRPGKRPPAFWRRFHHGCTLTIVAGLLFVAVCAAFGWLDNYRVLIGEVIATLAFGASWLFKGAEADYLARRPPERQKVAA